MANRNGRPLGSANRQTLEFAKRFDALCKEHIDPLVLMFQIAQAEDKKVGNWGHAHRIEASKTLLSYRYPKLKAVEITDKTDKPLQISWLDQLAEALLHDKDGGSGLRADSDSVSTKEGSTKATH
jgi:hypothetical protein